MAEQQTPLVTMEAVAAAITAALKPVTEALAPIVQNQKVIADTMAADAKAKADAAKAAEGANPAAGEAAKPLTVEDVNKLVADSLKARDTAAQTDAARAGYIADKLKNVPAVYHGKLGSDPSKWPAEEQAIRESLKSDLAALGVQPKDVGGGNPGGATGSAGTPAKAGGFSSLTPGQNAFAAGLVIPTAATTTAK